MEKLSQEMIERDKAHESLSRDELRRLVKAYRQFDRDNPDAPPQKRMTPAMARVAREEGL